MKLYKFITIGGNIAMLIACIFLMVNLFIERELFPGFVTIPLLVLGLIGNVLTLIKINKK
nr:hypothetical protein [Clostridia bacterium]